MLPLSLSEGSKPPYSAHSRAKRSELCHSTDSADLMPTAFPAGPAMVVLAVAKLQRSNLCASGQQRAHINTHRQEGAQKGGNPALCTSVLLKLGSWGSRVCVF